MTLLTNAGRVRWSRQATLHRAPAIEQANSKLQLQWARTIDVSAGRLTQRRSPEPVATPANIASMVRGLFRSGWGALGIALVACLAFTSLAAAHAADPTPTSVAPTGTVLAPDAVQTPAASSPPDTFRDRENRLALLLGRARVDAGLLPLARSPALDRAALAHAQDMAAQGYMEHDAPDGSTPGSRAMQQGYDTGAGASWMVLEAISAISDEPEGALGWWLGDGLHRRLVLRSGWRELGVGYATGGPYGRFWVALLGCRPNVLPPVLLDDVLAVPDENCGATTDAFGAVQSLRVGETSALAQGVGWEPYAARRPWPDGRPAVVELRDANGHELEARATDPTGAPTTAP